MFYERLFDCLNRHGIRYLVVGGLAVNLHGVVRLTLDVDIAVDPAVDQSDAWDKACAELGLRPRQPVTWRQMYSTEERHRLHQEKGLIAFCLLPSGPEDPVIDLLFEPGWIFAEAWARRKTVTTDGIDIPLASIADLIAMKTEAGREKDLRDIKYLTIISRREDPA